MPRSIPRTLPYPLPPAGHSPCIVGEEGNREAGSYGRAVVAGPVLQGARHQAPAGCLRGGEGSEGGLGVQSLWAQCVCSVGLPHARFEMPVCGVRDVIGFYGRGGRGELRSHPHRLIHTSTSLHTPIRPPTPIYTCPTHQSASPSPTTDCHRMHLYASPHPAHRCKQWRCADAHGDSDKVRRPGGAGRPTGRSGCIGPRRSIDSEDTHVGGR